METGAITQYVDVAQLVLYVFWAFFAGLIYYLLRENHREGYPMDSGRENGPRIEGWPRAPEPKTYKMSDGRELQSPDLNRADADFAAQPTHRWNGAPLEPVGNPLLAGVGSGAWSRRADVPDHLFDGSVKIVPLAIASDFAVHMRDIDPRGLKVLGADGEQAGTVTDLWIDQAEMMFRYLEVKLSGGRSVLLPMNFAYVDADAVRVKAILAEQFADVPALRTPGQITLLEEEKIMAYYGAGSLYATPQRQEPLI